MTKLMCAVYDTVSQMYAPPFYALSKGDAIRSFSNAVNDKNMGDLHKHPKDFLLYFLGEFDDRSGSLSVMDPPERLGLGSDFVLSNGVGDVKQLVS